MAFPEDIRKKVIEKAAFQCCRCRKIGGVEVHHIISQKDGGTDDIENAAPLCPSCHADFGDNPMKRKEITHMRNWWYGRMEKKYPDHLDPNLEKVSKLVTDIQEKQENMDQNVAELKSMLLENYVKPIEQLVINIDPSSAQNGASAVVTASTELQLTVEGNPPWIKKM